MTYKLPNSNCTDLRPYVCKITTIHSQSNSQAYTYNLASSDKSLRKNTHPWSRYCKSRIFRMHFIFVYFVRGGFCTKIKCILKIQSKSENPQRLVAVRKFHAYERSGVPRIRKFSAYELFWIYSIYNGAYADMAAKCSWQCKRSPEMGFPRFLLAYFLKVNEPQRLFSSGILLKRHCC